jgi:hypothetical protein
MEITLSRVIDAARQRRAAVTAEAAGYVVLLILQRVAARPCSVTAELVLLTATGEVRIEAGPAVSAREAEIELRRLLAALLALSQSAPPALHAAGERGAVGDLGALESELLAALIPLNHAAAGRALARLYRETLRAPRATLAGNDASPVPSSVASQRTPLPVAPAVHTPSPVAAVVRTPLPAAAVVHTPLPAAAVVHTPLPAAAVVHTPLPAAAVRTPSPVAVPVRAFAELEIDVDLDADVAAAPEARQVQALTPPQPVGPVLEHMGHPLVEEYSPTFAVASAVSDEDLEPSVQRSDLRELLNGFLAHTRCEERMAADLRRMIGLEPGRGTLGHRAALGR